MLGDVAQLLFAAKETVVRHGPLGDEGRDGPQIDPREDKAAQGGARLAGGGDLEQLVVGQRHDVVGEDGAHLALQQADSLGQPFALQEEDKHGQAERTPGGAEQGAQVVKVGLGQFGGAQNGHGQALGVGQFGQ